MTRWWRRWQESRRCRRAAREADYQRQLNALIADYPDVDKFILAGLLSPHPGIALASSNTILSITDKRQREAMLRRIIREELAVALRHESAVAS